MTKRERKLGTWAGILSAVFAVLWFITFNMKDFFQAVPDWQNLTAYADAFRISRFTLIYPSLLLALTYLVLIASLHRMLTEDKKIWSLIALAVGILFTDSPQDRDTLIAEKLFKRGPDRLGIFATRAPARPNPIMVSTIQVSSIDFEKGIIETPFVYANDSTPVLDIKPYFPMERVQNPSVPAWCRHWPMWQEETMNFDWQAEINFGSA